MKSSAEAALNKRNLAKLLVPKDASLFDALDAINRSGREIAFVVDRSSRVMGALTDGDVRRALLAGVDLRSHSLGKTMRRDFVWVGVQAGRAEALDLMLARGISQVPVLDNRGRLVGLHLLRGFLGGEICPHWAVLIAGGRGERLKPLTDHTPKPMILVAGRPILERLVLHLVGSGIRRIYISIGHLGHMIRDHFGDGERFGCHIEYLEEAQPLGTGGPLSLLPEAPKDPILVMNGDLVTQVDISKLFEFHARGKNIATMGVRQYAIDIPFGVANVLDGHLVALREKPTEQVLINAGTYVLSPRAVKMIPRGESYPITRLFETCLERKLAVGACVIEDEWSDVGRHDELRRARGLV